MTKIFLNRGRRIIFILCGYFLVSTGGLWMLFYATSCNEDNDGEETQDCVYMSFPQEWSTNMCNLIGEEIDTTTMMNYTILYFDPPSKSGAIDICTDMDMVYRFTVALSQNDDIVVHPWVACTQPSDFSFTGELNQDTTVTNCVLLDDTYTLLTSPWDLPRGSDFNWGIDFLIYNDGTTTAAQDYDYLCSVLQSIKVEISYYNYQ